MKPKLCILTFALIGALLTGCETSAALNKVQLNMTKQQVVALLGEPDSTSAQGTVEYMTYNLVVSSSLGTDRQQPYMVRLVNGRVESFGRYSQLYDLYNRPVTGGVPGSGSPIFPANSPYAQAMLNANSAAAAPSGTASSDLASQLERLKALKDQGILSDEEFQRAKAKILASDK